MLFRGVLRALLWEEWGLEVELGVESWVCGVRGLWGVESM